VAIPESPAAGASPGPAADPAAARDRRHERASARADRLEVDARLPVRMAATGPRWGCTQCSTRHRIWVGGGEWMSAEERIEHARLLYERAVFGGDTSALAEADRDLNAVEADLALARGRVMHARFLAESNEDPHELALFERAAQLYRTLGDLRGEGESLFWVGTFYQVVRGDNDAAVPVLERSRELAAEVGDKLTLSYALRHLGIAEHAAGRAEAAREWLEESVRLRREIGFLPGVAANLVGLAYLAAEEGRRDEALGLVQEAAAIAEASGAQGIMRQVEQARTQM
jgi:tetratricopeptide (TPR) repeat protein